MKYGGSTNLRFDDTNPVTEETESSKALRATSVGWVSNGPTSCMLPTILPSCMNLQSRLFQKGSLMSTTSTSDEIAAQKGTPTRPGTGNAYRNRTAEENLRLFSEMKEGKYKDGEKVLRVKGDLASPNMHMRDPVMYRIRHAPHHRTRRRVVYLSYVRFCPRAKRCDRAGDT